MRRIAAAVLLIACLHRGASAEPGPTEKVAPIADGSGGATAAPPPRATASSDDRPPEDKPVPEPPKRTVEKPAATPPSNKRRAALTLAGIYVGFSAWTYVAWYQQPIHEFMLDGDPSDGAAFRWLSPKTYAGGSDKLGHAWATMALARAGTEILRGWGGYDTLKASLVGASLSEALFFVVEVVDGYHYVFSTGDLVFDTLGAALAVAQSNYPRLDELVDFRVEYLPSKAYRRLATEGNVDMAEDYSGQTFMIAFHLGGIPALRDGRWSTWSRFVDVGAGFRSRGYKPDPPWPVTEEMPDYEMTQSMFLGVTLNAQGVFDYLLDERAPRVRKFTHGLFELFSVPYTTLPVVENTRSPNGPIPPSPF